MKLAYPNFSPDTTTKPSYNLNKWVKAMQDVYSLLHFGKDKQSALKEVVGNWSETEKVDFNHWMSYYEGNNHLKYKVAQQNFYVNDSIPGYYLPNPIKSPEINSQKDESNFNEKIDNSKVEAFNAEQKKKLIEEQRKKILSRLHSVEKLLSSSEGHLFAGKEFENLLSSIYNLKKQIQTINKISLSTQIYYDMIIAQANSLASKGFERPSLFLRKFAQNTPGSFDANQGVLPLGSAIDNTGTLENPAPPVEELNAALPSGTSDVSSDSKDPMDELLENLETSGLTDINLTDDDEIMLNQDVGDDDLWVEAQLSPTTDQATAPTNESTNLQAITPTNEVIIDEPVGNKEELVVEENDNFDNMVDSALSGVTINDVIKKLEDISNIFKNREIARQLSFVDIMLDRLGLASLFPNLAEAERSMLDATQYCMSRVDDILSKLRGTQETNSLTLTPEPQAISEEAANAKKLLEEANNKDKARKEMRKKVQDAETETKTKELAAPSPEVQQVVEQPAQEVAQQPAKIV